MSDGAPAVTTMSTPKRQSKRRRWAGLVAVICLGMVVYSVTVAIGWPYWVASLISLPINFTGGWWIGKAER